MSVRGTAVLWGALGLVSGALLTGLFAVGRSWWQERQRPAPESLTLEKFEESVAAHLAEVRSPTWAAPTEAAIARGVSSEALVGSSVEGIDCRSHTCLLRISFSDYQEAYRATERLVRRNYEVNCVQTSVLPSSRGEVVRVRILFTC